MLSIEAQLFELKEFAAKEKLEIVKVQDFGSEFLANSSPPQAAKTVRTILRIVHILITILCLFPSESSACQMWANQRCLMR